MYRGKQTIYQRRQRGFTMLELLVVIAILGVIISIGWVGARNILRGQEASSAENIVKQSIWQGATGAAARGVRLHLVKDDNELRLVRDDNNNVVRRFELPDGADINVGNGNVLTFLPPGKILDTSLESLPAPFQLSTSKSTLNLTVSVIGEVKAELAKSEGDK